MSFDGLSKVPFGLDIETALYVDVHDVPGGAACGCECPLCKTPLVARQGKVNAWHFAHATRGTQDKTKQECEYSFYVSVTQMAKQLFNETPELTIRLPEYIADIWEQRGVFYKALVDSVVVTPESTITPDSVEVESRVGDQAVDVLCHIKGVPLAIGLTHPERQFHFSADRLEDNRIGVLQIDLTPTSTLFFNKRLTNQQSFIERLKRYLFDEIENKKWIYHPRYRKLVQPNSAQTAKTRKPGDPKLMDALGRALKEF